MFRLKYIFVLVLCFTPVFLEEITFNQVTVQEQSKSGDVSKTITTNSLKEVFPKRVVNLSIRDQNIPVLYEESLSYLSIIMNLVLKNNGIIELKSYVFNNSYIGIIDLSHNKISKIHKNAFDNLGFRELDLSNNQITALDEAWFKNISSVRNIYLNNNLIKRISVNALDNLRKPEMVDIITLSHNELTEILPNVFQNTAIDNLDLSNNHIEKIASNSFVNSGIREINLDHNKLSIWDSNWFYNCSVLRNISLKHNLIETIPKDALQNLQKGRGRLSLGLSHNKIKTIEDGAFDGIENMKELLLDNNNIESVPSLPETTTIEIIDLEVNQIRLLDNFERVLIATKGNYISGNPLYCDCSGRIQNWAERNPQKPVRLPAACVPRAVL